MHAYFHRYARQFVLAMRTFPLYLLLVLNHCFESIAQNSKKSPENSIVAIYENQQLTCVGAYISNVWILTAAHCISNYPSRSYTLQLQWTVGVPTYASISGIIIHDSYKKHPEDYDIGLIRLAQPFANWSGIYVDYVSTKQNHPDKYRYPCGVLHRGIFDKLFTPVHIYPAADCYLNERRKTDKQGLGGLTCILPYNCDHQTDFMLMCSDQLLYGIRRRDLVNVSHSRRRRVSDEHGKHNGMRQRYDLTMRNSDEHACTNGFHYYTYVGYFADWIEGNSGTKGFATRSPAASTTSWSYNTLLFFLVVCK